MHCYNVQFATSPLVERAGGISEHASHKSLSCRREKPAFVPRGREHQHIRDWRGNHPQVLLARHLAALADV